FGSGELHKQIVPPPAQLGGGSDEHRAIGGLGDGAVVSPPGQLSSGGAVQRQSGSGFGNGLSGSVVPPPAQLSGGMGGTHQGRGDGPGGGVSGEGSGAGKEGSGRGSDKMARGGISAYPGPGGAGSGASGNPPMPGVAVKGGSSDIVTLPGFSTGANGASIAGR